MVSLKINSKVEIIVSGEKGEVIGYAEYRDYPNQYYVNYKSGDGRTVKDWFIENELALIGEKGAVQIC